MKHKKLVITATCLVFVMVCILCLQQLFSVRDITVVYSVTKQENTEDVLSMLEKYKGKSMFFVDTQEIKDEITANKYLKVMSVEKNYPNEIIINLTERFEKFYYKAQDGVYYFDNEYFIVRKSDAVSGKNLIELEFNDIEGNKTEVDCSLKNIFSMPYEMNSEMDKCFSQCSEIEHNILKAGITFTTEKGNYRIRLYMREGVVIEIRNASDRIEEKTALGVNYYLNLEESRKIKGSVIVDSLLSGELKANHTFNGQ